jgi:1A family penicillin-binding protein
MADTQGSTEEIKAFRGVKFADLLTAYRQICKSETVPNPVVDARQVIEFYNATMVDLPDHTRLRGLKLPGLSNVFDGKGAKYAELFEPENRRISVPLSQVPEHVQAAFLAAEDKRFRQHKGIDERSVIRAFLNAVAEAGRRQGGSTITQQVVKNLLVGDQVTYERKIREIIIASRVEHTLSKDEILELYLNSIYLGRGSWGIEMASRVYFGKSAKDLSVIEGAFLAGLPKGPNAYNPDRYPQRMKERLAYVLSRMEEDGILNAEQMKQLQSQQLAFIPYQRLRRDNGFHFVDLLGREARANAGGGSLTGASYTVRTTIQPALQRAAETALQDGLARYEQTNGRLSFRGAEANLAETIAKLSKDPKADRTRPFWQQVLERAHPPLYDVHWTPAIVVEKVATKGGFDSIRVGLRDGRIMPLSTYGANTRRSLGIYDLVYVKVVEGKGKEGTRVELRSRPTVQGAVVVLENQTGRILAMVGGFSYPHSQLNRATQSRRQPGSSFKPMTYLAALASGLQPNTLVQDSPLTLPPIGSARYAQVKDYWTPKNYDGGSSGTMTLRRALEASKNLVTARLLAGGIADRPEESLDRICRLSVELGLYQQCERYYPFVLGAQGVRPIDMAAFYATIANEGMRPTPYAIESIEQDGKTIYKHAPKLIAIGAADKPAFFQIKTILQGVLARGTARSIGALSPYVGGKTGTSDEENDAWFVGFSNEVTVAVWVGYDNAGTKRRTLGHGGTGSRAAIPIWEPVMQAVWTHYTPKTALRGPSPEAARQLIALPISLQSGERVQDRRVTITTTSSDGTVTTSNVFREYFRLDATGKFTETQYKIVSRGDSYLYHGDYPGDGQGGFFQRDYDGTPFFGRPGQTIQRSSGPFPFQFPFFGNNSSSDNRPRVYDERGRPPQYYQQPQQHQYQQQQHQYQQQQRQRRVEPEPRRDDFFWGGRRF